MMIIMKILIMFDYMVNMIGMIRIRKMASAIELTHAVDHNGQC